MKYRFAKLKDIDKIVHLHYAVRKKYPIGIFSFMDKNFLKCYYNILLNDVNSIIICAEDSNGVLLGFCSANLDIKKQLNNFKRKRHKMFFFALTSIVKKPSLITGLLSRYKSINNDKKQYISNTGARLEYWVWSKDSNDNVSSLIMHEILLRVIESLGVKEVKFEVDKINKKVLKFHKLNGAKIEDVLVLDDLRERVKMKYNFIDRTTKIRLYKDDTIFTTKNRR